MMNRKQQQEKVTVANVLYNLECNGVKGLYTRDEVFTALEKSINDEKYAE